MKSTYELTKHINTYTSQQIFLIRIQPKRNLLIPREENNISENFGLHEDEKLTLEEQDIEKNHKNMVGKSLDIGSHTRDGLSGHTPQDGLFAREFSSSLREIRLRKQIFPVSKPLSDIKYHHLYSQNDNAFRPFNDQLGNAHATYFTEFETTKGNIERFLFDPLIALLIEKLSYQNADK